MLHLLWSALNIALLVYFIVICFRATRLIRENSGLFTSLLFGFGLLSFIVQPGKVKNTENQIVKQGFVAQDRLDPTSMKSITLALEESLGNSTNLRIHYGKDSTGKLAPIDAFSSQNGFVGGREWEPHRILVKTGADGDDFNYTVDGILRWRLLGVTVYYQGKNYQKTE